MFSQTDPAGGNVATQRIRVAFIHVSKGGDLQHRPLPPSPPRVLFPVPTNIDEV